MIKLVLFDYGGVLTQGGTKGSLRRLVAKTMEVPLEEAERLAPTLLRQIIDGTITTEQFLQTLAELFPQSPKPTAERLLQNAEIFSPSPAVYDLARELREAGIRTAMLSNMFELTATKLRKEGYYDGFDPVILSYEEHMSKPDPEIYQRAVQRLGLPAGEILFIDDQQRFLDPAKAVGMQVLLAESPEQIVADTRRMVFGDDRKG